MTKTLTKTATLMDLLSLRPQHLRSVQIERDYADPEASRHYVATPFVEETFERLARSLNFGATERAWRLTGDYGSGKSSFLLAFARFAAGADDALPTALAKTPRHTRLEPILVVGERETIGRSLLRAIRQRSPAKAPSRRVSSARLEIGAIDGARSPRGRKRPAACMSVRRTVRGATVKTTASSARAASAETTRAMSAPS